MCEPLLYIQLMINNLYIIQNTDNLIVPQITHIGIKLISIIYSITASAFFSINSHNKSIY